MADASASWRDLWIEGDVIGSGGQGIVTELRAKQGNRRAVLKQIVPRWRNDPQAQDRLRHEAQVLTTLGEVGAKVPAIYDSLLKRPESEPFIVMEFIAGTRFDRWLTTCAPVDAVNSATVTRAIAETVQLCHSHKIGHRDLKPSNIILKDGDVASPYIIDFGISFDSQQTVILTREGEMFWNEFIILPECQDQEGGHRDMRSDITALVGVFFACLTGKRPVVLRDAANRAPHQRHEALVARSAFSHGQSERLMWFFDRGFAFTIADRFQTMEEFSRELSRFASRQPDGDLDLAEEFGLLSKTARAKDRGVQLALLQAKLAKAIQKINEHVSSSIRSEIGQLGGDFSISEWNVARLTDPNKPALPGAELLHNGHAQAYAIRRNHLKKEPVAMLVAFGVGMNIEFYGASYTASESQLAKPDRPLSWSRIAVFDEAQSELSERTLSVIVAALRLMLTQEVRNVRRSMATA